MADDEYIYRLGLDARQVKQAANSLLTIFGEVDASFDKLTGKSAQAAKRIQKDLVSIVGGLDRGRPASANDQKAAAALRAQKRNVDAITVAYREASAGFSKYQTNVARGLQRPGGFQPARQSNARLTELANQGAALKANGVSQSPADRALGTAVQAEIASRKRTTDQAIAQKNREASALEAANQREAAGAARANAAFRAEAKRTADQQTRLRLELAAGSERYATRQIADAQRSAKAQAAAQIRAAREYEAALPRLRYALYDVAQTAGLAGAGLLGGGVAVLKVAADYEQAYASVKRTSDILTDPSLSGAQRDSQFAALRTDLVDLSKQIPVTFQDITEIAKTGNQLGIASGNITNFTKTVAEFTAVTGVGTEEAATAFGRLGEILNDTDYKKVGDEIAYLGVKSVASEKDIIDTATQLAVSGQGIGLTTKEVLALSTTVAGLGVKPEQARGTFIRSFSAIGNAVNKGGESLQRIANIAGTTSEAFQTEFNAGGGRAYDAFLQFSRGLGTSSAEINNNLASIGITAVRDRQTLGLLAQNGGRALKDLENAGVAAGNNFLGTAYEVQAQTVTNRLITLGNQVKAIFDSIGQQTTGPLSVVLELTQKLLERIQKITDSPLAGSVSAIAIGLSVLAGALLIGAAGFARILATMITFRQISQTAIGGVTGLDAAMAAATGSAQRMSGSIQVLNTTNVELAATTRIAAGAQSTLASSQLGVGASTGRLNGALSKLTGFLGKAGLVGVCLSLVAAIPGVISGISDMANELSGASVEADDLAKKLSQLSDVKVSAQNLADIKKALPGADGIAPGDSIGGAFLNPFGRGTANGRYYTEGNNGAKGGTISAGQAAVNQINLGQRTPGQTVTAFNGAAQFDRETDTQLAKIKTVDAALTALKQNGDEEGYQKGLDLYLASMKKVGVETPDATAALTGLQAALKGTGTEAKTAGEEAAAAAQVLSDALDDIFDPSINADKITSDLETLGKSAVDNGALVAFAGGDMKQAISDIGASSSDLGVVKGRLESLYAGLLNLGYSVPALASLRQAIDSISAASIPSTVNLDSFTKGVDGARKTSDKAAESIRTLSDYAGDLSTAFGRSFEIRFGTQTATDKLTSGFRDLRDSIKDSREELRKAKADLGLLESDQATRKYQLSISNRFGDTATGAELQAEIAKGDADIADKKRDVASARTKNSRELTGNSDGAIANRQRFQSLISNGQDVLTAMAKNGATPEELSKAADRFKKQLVDQGVQMGYSRKDLLVLAQAYDDYKKVIDGIPRKITSKVQADTDPATKALAEYREKLKDLDGATVTTKVVQQAIDLADASPDSVAALKARQSQAAADARASKQAQLGMRDGGYTGDLPRWQQAGTIATHGQEFVLNARGTRMFPRQMLESANAGIAPRGLNVKATATLPSGATVSLSRQDRALMAAGGGSQAVTVNADRFGSAMDAAFVRSNRRGDN